MTGNSGAWGFSMWRDDNTFPGQLSGISLDGGDAIIPYLATDSLGWLTEPPDGLGVPPVRNGDVTFAQRDGVVQFADYYEPRILTFQVTICNEGCPGCDPVGPAETFLLLNGVSPGRARTLDADHFDILGNLDLRIHAALDDWTPAASQSLLSKSMTSGNQISWRLTVLTNGKIRFGWSADGSTVLTADSTVAPTVADGADLWVRSLIDVDNGAAGRDIFFYTSTDGVTWTQLGTTVTQAGVTSIFNSTAAINIGARDSGTLDRMSGKVYSAEVIRVNGNVVEANPDFTTVGAGSTVFEDGVGNIWEVFSPAVISSTPGTPPLTARQKVKRLTKEWSRNCNGASLVLFPDCYDPNATEEEKTYGGPYIVHGRPRVAEVAWQRSDIGCAEITLRFDAEDARLILADVPSGSQAWTGVQSLIPDANENLVASSYRLAGKTMTLNGATVTDNFFTGGAPDGGSYFSRDIITANTSSPMTMDVTASGTSAVPVVVGNSYTVSWWAEKSIAGGPTTQAQMSWYTAAGAFISTSSGSTQAVGTSWSRFSSTFVAPATAAFGKPILAWAGTALVGQGLDFAQVWMNHGAAATAPDTMTVVGDLCVYPRIVLFSTMTAPITVTYGTHVFVYNANVSSSSVTIDTRWGRASEGTVDATQNLSGDFSSPLEPGVHDVIVSTGNSADSGNATVEWENAVVSG